MRLMYSKRNPINDKVFPEGTYLFIAHARVRVFNYVTPMLNSVKYK